MPHPWKQSEQPDLVEDVPAHCREVGLDDPSNPNHFVIKTCSRLGTSGRESLGAEEVTHGVLH